MPLKRAAVPVLLLVLPTLALGNPKPDSLRARVVQELPEKVRALVPGKTSRADVTKLFGKSLPDSKAEEAYFSTLGGPSSDLTIGFESDKVSYFAFDIPAKSREKLALSQLRSLIPKSAMDSARKEWEKGAAAPDAGIEIKVRVPQEGVLLRFVETEKAPLKAIVLWKSGEKAP